MIFSTLMSKMFLILFLSLILCYVGAQLGEQGTVLSLKIEPSRFSRGYRMPKDTDLPER